MVDEEKERQETETRLINTWAQMILDLIMAARIPVGFHLLASMSIALASVEAAVRKQVGETEWENLTSKKNELYLAHNMKEAIRGGSAKVIVPGE